MAPPTRPSAAPPRRMPKLTTQLSGGGEESQQLLLLARKKRIAYTTSVSQQRDVCNALMLFADLSGSGSEAVRILYYPRTWDNESTLGRTWKRLMRAAELRYAVILRPLEVVNERAVLAAAFAETEFVRVVWLDHAGSLLRNLDELLLSLPSAVFAMPRRAEGRMWILEPSMEEARMVMASKGEEDLYAEHTLLLPQWPWFLEVGEFRRKEHAGYLRPAQTWDPEAVRGQAAYVSFRDPQTPMPWTAISGKVLQEVRPLYAKDAEVWWALYRKWERSRADICGLDLEAPEDRK
jgi:hypothetical protein